MTETNINFSDNDDMWKTSYPICEKCNIVEKITKVDVIKWYLPSIFNDKKPEGVLYLSKLEKVKDLARMICLDPKVAEKLVEEYWKGK